MTGTITSPKLTSLVANEIMSKYIRNLCKNSINFTYIFRYLKFVDNYKNGTRLEHLLIKLSESDLDQGF